jgi:outer membrane protein
MMTTLNTSRIAFFGALILITQGAVAATDLSEAYRIARGNDMAYAAAQSRWSATREKLPQAQALLRPSVEATAQANRQHTDTRYSGASLFPGGTQTFSTHGYGVSLRQALYRKQDWLQLDQARQQLLQADARLADAEQTLILRVAQAYFDVLGAEDDLSFVKAQKTAIAEQLALARRQFEVGTATITDANEAQSRFDLASAQEIAAQSELQVRLRALRRVLGTMPQSLSRLADPKRIQPPKPNDLDWWEAQSREMNPLVLVQTMDFELASREIKRQRAGHLPTVDLVASYQDDSANGSASSGAGSDSANAMIGVQLRLPLYSGGGISSRVREALLTRDAARDDLENARRGAALDASQAYLGVTDGIGRVRALEQAIISSESALASSQRGWEVGVRTSIDVLNAQQQLYGARRDLAKARYVTILSMLQLHAAAGTLDEQELTEVNQWLK